jgi:hypothetical protein
MRSQAPSAAVLEAGRDLGGAARNAGVAHASTPYVAFSDDDSWWAPGSLARATALLDDHPSVGLICARVLLGPEERLDPICRIMAASPLPRPDGMPGPCPAGFVACASVVRRGAFLEAGGSTSGWGWAARRSSSPSTSSAAGGISSTPTRSWPTTIPRRCAAGRCDDPISLATRSGPHGCGGLPSRPWGPPAGWDGPPCGTRRSAAASPRQWPAPGGWLGSAG